MTQPVMNAQRYLAARAVMNAANGYMPRRGAYASQNTKHNLEFDFGYPAREADIPFDSVYQMYRRNGIAKALVTKTAGKTWQEQPCLREDDDDSREETTLERSIRQRFSDIRFWQGLHEADSRSMVGKYAGVILRLGDGERFDQPVTRVPGGVDGIAGVIPAWEGQLEVADWDYNPDSPTYGEPTMFTFNESSVDSEEGKIRSFRVHPDRCYLWSKDRTTWGESKLEGCYNALMDVEKIRGAGGEGFWKNAKAQPVLQADTDVDFNQLAAMLGVELSGIGEALDDVVEKWSKGFDVSLMLQGMEAKTLQVALPQPEEFYNVAIQEIAASWPIPQKILVGMQTGERASTEDAREWAQTNMSRRANMVVPNIMDLVGRFERWGILPERDWYLDWADLSAPSMGEKMDIVAKMAEANAKMAATGGVIFTDDEMRAIADYAPLEDEFAERGEGLPMEEEDDAQGNGA